MYFALIQQAGVKVRAPCGAKNQNPEPMPQNVFTNKNIFCVHFGKNQNENLQK
jgi:hypothetical protein